MTRKDYELLARAIKREHDAWGQDTPDSSVARVTVFRLAGHIAYELAQDNPRFSEDKFLKACGL